MVVQAPEQKCGLHPGFIQEFGPSNRALLTDRSNKTLETGEIIINFHFPPSRHNFNYNHPLLRIIMQ